MAIVAIVAVVVMIMGAEKKATSNALGEDAAGEAKLSSACTGALWGCLDSCPSDGCKDGCIAGWNRCRNR